MVTNATINTIKPATPLEELDLYHLDWDSPEVAADPYPYFDEARKKHPWLAKTNAGNWGLASLPIEFDPA